MSDRHGRKPTQHDLEAPAPERIRNVVLVGPSGSGKTSLVEALLLSSGAINRPSGLSLASATRASSTERPVLPAIAAAEAASSGVSV